MGEFVTGLPGHAGRVLRQDLGAVVAKLGVGGVDVDAAIASLWRLVAACDAATVHDGGSTRRAPRRVVVPAGACRDVGMHARI